LEQALLQKGHQFRYSLKSYLFQGFLELELVSFLQLFLLINNYLFGVEAYLVSFTPLTELRVLTNLTFLIFKFPREDLPLSLQDKEPFIHGVSMITVNLVIVTIRKELPQRELILLTVREFHKLL
jgi:hypothetical protein